MKRKYGVISTQLVSFSGEGAYTIILGSEIRAYSLQNSGAKNCVVTLNGKDFTIKPDRSFTFGGYTDCVRVDDLKFAFNGVGSELIEIFQDVMLEQPNFISTTGNGK